MKLNAKQLREVKENDAKNIVFEAKNPKNPIYFILENVYDTYNIGGLFRLADGLNITKMYLCGEMETPPNHRILKASIGTYKVVDWEYKESAELAISELREKYKNSPNQVQIAAIEQSKGSVDYRSASYTEPIALVLGNETFGVSEDTLKLCDQILEIPMWGINKSLNVIVSAAIVSYHVVSKIASK